MQESYHIHDCASQEISRMELCILEASWQIKRIDPLIRIEIDIEIGSSYGIYQRSIFILWVEDDHIRPHHEST